MNTFTNTATFSNNSPEQIVIAFRKTALVAGIVYLLTFVSIPTLSLYEAIHHPNYITGTASDTPVIMGGILELVVGLACIASAVALYPVLKLQSEAGALGLVAARVLEATMIFAGVACLLTVVTLKQSGVGLESVITGRALVTMYDRIFSLSQNLMPAVNDLILGILFYQSRLIPRVLSVVAIVGSFTLLGADIAIIFGAIELRSPLTGLAAMGVALFEFSLGVWLVVTGLRFSRRGKAGK
jgi:hypothetical protein